MSLSSHKAMFRSIELASCASSLRTGKVMLSRGFAMLTVSWAPIRPSGVVDHNLENPLRRLGDELGRFLGQVKGDHGMQDTIRRKPLVAEVIDHGSLQILGVLGRGPARGIVPGERRQRSQKCEAVVEKLLAQMERGLIGSINADAHDPAALARCPYGVPEGRDLARAFDGD